MMNVKKLHRKLLPSVKAFNRQALPHKPGCYYVFRGWDLIYVGRAETSIKQRWQGHHQLDNLKQSDNIHYWVMPRILIKDREAKDIRAFKPILNKRNEPRDWLGQMAGLIIDAGCWALSAAIAWVILRLLF